MRLARILGAIGRGLISAGVIVLLFVAYQLWGTGLQHSAAQGDLGNEFEEATGITVESTDVDSLAEAARASQQAISTGAIFATESEATPADSSQASDDTDTDDGAAAADPALPTADLVENNFSESERQEIQAKLYPNAGEPLARIVIPAINVDQITVEGVSVEDLRKGPGHYQSTPNPGQAGNSAIAGHRTTYGAPFHRVDELKPGDPIFVTTVQGVFEYRVLPFENPAGGDDLGYFIVSPSDTWVLDQKPGQNLLTLTACHPKYSARQRIIVQAELVGEPAATIPRDEALELEAVNLDSGATDERAAEADAIPEEEQVIISEEVAIDDDPTVDADGNPIDGTDEATTDSEAAGTEDEGAAAQDAAADDGASEATDTAAEATEAEDATQAESTDATDEAVSVDATESVASDDIELTSAQTPFNTDDFGEGLNGDPTKVRPAVLWGIAGFFIWLAAWFMGQRLDRKWTMYAVAAAPFIVVLWSTFVNVDQALPSY